MCCTNLGWSWDQAEAQLDLHRLRSFSKHWTEAPPERYLVAAYLGYKPPRPQEAAQQVQQILTSQLIKSDAPKLDDSAWQAYSRKDGDG
jgi:hypothetical protein